MGTAGRIGLAVAAVVITGTSVAVATSNFPDYARTGFAMARWNGGEHGDMGMGMHGGGRGGMGMRDGGRGGMGMLCSGEQEGMLDGIAERISSRLKLSDVQKTALGELRSSAGDALEGMKGSCEAMEKAESGTLPEKLDIMEGMHASMGAAMEMVKPKVEAFYNSLDEYQKGRLDAFAADMHRGGKGGHGMRDKARKGPGAEKTSSSM